MGSLAGLKGDCNCEVLLVCVEILAASEQPRRFTPCGPSHEACTAPTLPASLPSYDPYDQTVRGLVFQISLFVSGSLLSSVLATDMRISHSWNFAIEDTQTSGGSHPAAAE